jgi:hypothetical protein
MNTPTLWTYWEGKPSDLQTLCLDSIVFHNPTAVIMDDARIRDEVPGGDEALDFLEGLPHPQRSDFIRLWLIGQYGGVWMDADSICVAPLDFLGQSEWDLIGTFNAVRQKTGGLLATPWGARMGSPLVREAIIRCRKLLEQIKSGTRIPYGSTSVGLLSELWKLADPARVKRLPHWRYHRVPWYNARRAFHYQARAEEHETGPHWSPRACVYHLTNVVTKGPLARFSREELLTGNSFTSFLLQKAFNLPPAVPRRSLEIIRRIGDREAIGAEIGVFAGMNAVNVLQKCPRTRLFLVDPWEALPGYDNAPGRLKGQSAWNRVLERARKLLRPFDDRVRIIREPSTQAAGLIENGSLDFVFVDDDHREAMVDRSLAAWVRKIKPGGWFGGHDYGRDTCPGVKPAVDRLAATLGKPVQTASETTWFIDL